MSTSRIRALALSEIMRGEFLPRNGNGWSVRLKRSAPVVVRDEVELEVRDALYGGRSGTVEPPEPLASRTRSRRSGRPRSRNA